MDLYISLSLSLFLYMFCHAQLRIIRIMKINCATEMENLSGQKYYARKY